MPNEISTPPKKSAKKAGKKLGPSKETLRLRRAEMLLEISQQMAALESLDEVLQALLETIIKETTSERGSSTIH